jgi:hypothetical protein
VGGQIRTLDAEQLPEDLVPLLDLVCPHLPPPPAIVHVSGGCKRQRPSFACPSRKARSSTQKASKEAAQALTMERQCHKTGHLRGTVTKPATTARRPRSVSGGGLDV